MIQHSKNLLLILFISNLLYFHSYQSPFHLDDFLTIVNRPLVSANQIETLDTFWDDAGSSIFHNRVFLLYTFALNYSIGGLNVFGYHLVNVIIHSIVSILLYFLVKEILICQSLSSSKFRNKLFQHSNVIPLLTALLFSIHPLQSEAVTYISSRSALAVTLFFLGSFLCFVKGVSTFVKPTKGIKLKVFFYFLGGLLFFLLGTGFKETIIVLPLILFLYIFLFHFERVRQLKKTLISGSLLIFFLSVHAAGFLVYSKEIGRLTNLYQKSEFQERSIQKATVKLKEIKKKQRPVLNLLYFSNDRPNVLTSAYNLIYSKISIVYVTAADTLSYSPKVYFLSELEIIGLYYLKILFLPFNQSVFPDFPEFNTGHWKTLASSIFIIVSISIYCLSSNLKLVSFCFFWYIFTITPSSSVIPLNDLVSEHRTYLPNIGFFIAVSTGLATLMSSKRRFMVLSFILVIIISACMLTLKRNYIWQSEISLWEDAVKKAPRHVKSINALGLAYTQKGENDKAQAIFQQGLKVDPFDYNININMGRIFRDRGNLDKAEELFQLAALISKDYLAYINLGSIYLERNQYYQGILHLKEALRLKPDSDLAHFYLGNAYNELEKYQKAILHFEKSIELNPGYANAYNNLGYTYWHLGEYDQAYDWFIKAINKQPDLPTPYLNIGNYFLFKGNKKQAEDFLNRYQEKLKNDKN